MSFRSGPSHSLEWFTRDGRRCAQLRARPKNIDYKDLESVTWHRPAELTGTSWKRSSEKMMTAKRWLVFSLRALAFVGAAAFLIVTIFGVMLWPRNLRGFARAQKYYWRELIHWARQPLRN